jgi:hypothetical protein
LASEKGWDPALVSKREWAEVSALAKKLAPALVSD